MGADDNGERQRTSQKPGDRKVELFLNIFGGNCRRRHRMDTSTMSMRAGELPELPTKNIYKRAPAGYSPRSIWLEWECKP